jgi:two-component system capsular synthesis sensor histidine kinase RcsC
MTFFEEIENRRKHIAKLSNIGEQLSFLIVDDCPVSRKVARRLLVNQGQHVMEAIDGLDCIRIYEEVVENGGGKLDVILMDEDMPLMSGKEASYVLRSKGYDNPIIGLSGEIRDYVINSFIDHGANAVLPKPLSIKMLEAELARLG